MYSKSRLVALAAAILFLPAPGSAADATAPDAEAALQHETAVASSRIRRLRETPAVVTVLTRDDLLASGVRDLGEALAAVPGFALALDVSNGVGAGFRGIWGHEGKILYLVDGIEMNDLSYGTFLLSQHVAIDQVDRIEIVRGPGSAIYGGQAELAVVNVITRAASMVGTGLSLSGGRVSHASRGALTAAAGGSAGGLRLGATASTGTGVRSDRTYTDFAGDGVDLADASRISPALVTARAVWRRLDVRALYDDYRVTSRDGYDLLAPRNVNVRWRTAAVDARAALSLGDAVTIVPQLTYRWESPWQADAEDVPAFYYDVANERLTGRLTATWDTFTGPGVLVGAEATLERGRIVDFANGLLSYAGESTVRNTILAGFAEVALDTEWANLLAGARVERHSAYETAFVPRFSITRVFEPFHAKLLASGAYRAPSIENVNYAATTIRPERTWAFEAEVGWRLGDAVRVVANVFDVTIQRPIVFSFDGSDVYTNEGRTGSRGVEAELHVRWGTSSAEASWSYYDARGKNRVPAYAVAGDESLLVGFAGHKAVLSARLRPLSRLVLSPSLTLLSERAAYDGTEAAGDPAVGRVGARAYLDLFAAWRDLGTKGLEVGLGIRDALDQGQVFVQPYPGGHAPLPGTGREVWLRLRYDRG